MFRDNLGNISSAKVMSFIGFLAFIIVSIALLWIDVSKFDYILFSVIAGGGGISSRIADKVIANYYGNQQKQRGFPPLSEQIPTPKG